MGTVKVANLAFYKKKTQAEWGFYNELGTWQALRFFFWKLDWLYSSLFPFLMLVTLIIYLNT